MVNKGLILLMVQKSCVYQLRLVVYLPLFTGFHTSQVVNKPVEAAVVFIEVPGFLLRSQDS